MRFGFGRQFDACDPGQLSFQIKFLILLTNAYEVLFLLTLRAKYVTEVFIIKS